MDSKNKYLDFYKENFGQGKYCSKSWGLASYEAGQQSKQAEIDKRLSDYQLEVSQVGQACVKWKEITEGKQAEIDDLKNKIQTALNRACMLQNSSGERIYTELKEILK